MDNCFQTTKAKAAEGMDLSKDTFTTYSSFYIKYGSSFLIVP